MKVYSYHIKIDKTGNIVFKSENHKAMFKRWLSQWADKDVALEVIEKKSKRSDEQNRYYFCI